MLNLLFLDQQRFTKIFKINCLLLELKVIVETHTNLRLYVYICYGECDKSGDYAYSPVIMYNSRSYWGMWVI